MSENPFPTDADRAAIWEMLMPRDFEAFAAGDWSMVDGDFDKGRFLGIHAHGSSNPDDWTAAFPRLEDYRDDWLRQAAASAQVTYAEPLVPALMRAVSLNRIDITGDVAVAHKLFEGSIAIAGASPRRLAGGRSITAARTTGAGKSLDSQVICPGT
jgi:hypothetical protein